MRIDEVPFDKLPELNHLTVERIDAQIAAAKPEELPKIKRNMQKVQEDLTRVNSALTAKSLQRGPRSNTSQP